MIDTARAAIYRAATAVMVVMVCFTTTTLLGAVCKAQHTKNTREGDLIRIEFAVDTSECTKLKDRTLRFTSVFVKGAETRTHDEADILPQDGGRYNHPVLIQDRFKAEGFVFRHIRNITLKCSCLTKQ